MDTLNAIATGLANRGWTMGEYGGPLHRSDLVLEVAGRRGDQTVVARSPYRRLAWQMAATQIIKVRREWIRDRLADAQQQLEVATDAEDRRRLANEIDIIRRELEADEAFRREWLR